MICEDKATEVCEEIHRLSGKRGWPYFAEAQLELVRIAKQYARDVGHLRSAITRLSEELDHCPDARELKLELEGRLDRTFSDYPTWKGFDAQ